MRGLLRLTWLEIKIFVREPLGVIGTVGIPLLIFVLAGRSLRDRPQGGRGLPPFLAADLPVFAALLIGISVVLSLVAVISIYREGGILKRLRATPLRPATILSAHVLVKLFFTAITLSLLILLGRRFYPLGAEAPLASFALALFVSTLSLLSLGFLIASLVPTARFAQPLATVVLYPMLGISGLFVPVEAMPPALQGAARLLPLTYATSLLRGIWHGDSWASHLGDVGALAVIGVVLSAVAVRVFRWE